MLLKKLKIVVLQDDRRYLNKWNPLTYLFLIGGALLLFLLAGLLAARDFLLGARDELN